MSEKRIENRFQEGLKNYTSSIDEDQLWSEIEGRVPKKKRRFIIWFLFGLIGFIASMTILWLDQDVSIQISNLSQNGSAVDVITNDVYQQKHQKSVAVGNKIESDENRVDKTKDQITNQNKSLATSNSASTPPFKQIIKSKAYSERGINEYSTSFVGRIIASENRNQINGIENLPIPIASVLNSSDSKLGFKQPKLTKKKPRRPKPKNKVRSSIGFNYFAGTSFISKNLSPQDVRFIEFGNAYFSQGVSISYDRYMTSNFYGKIVFSLDQTFKKYTDKISRDTLVPSSSGNQTLSYSKYSNGVIDTKSGIPIVKAVITRDVISLNSITSASIGLGIGYTQNVGRLNVNIEGDVQRTVYFDLKGLGREASFNRIESLKDFQDYFDLTPKYILNTQINAEFQLANTFSLTGGMQYQIGTSSLLIEQTGHSEKMNLLRLNVGIKKML